MRCVCAVLHNSGGYVNLSIYSGGVLKPVEKLALPETQRVRLIVQPLKEKGDNSRSAALQRLLVGIVASPLEKSYMIAFDANVLIYACDRLIQSGNAKPSS